MKMDQMDHREKRVSIIGAAIIDVLVGPVDASIYHKNSMPMERSRLSFGGDALNETVDLHALGVKARLISKVGRDEAGEQVISWLEKKGISTDGILREEGLETGLNVVLIEGNGERHFLTNPRGSLRKLSCEDVLPFLEDAGDIVCLASMFVSSEMTISAMEKMFKKIKEKEDRILVVDMTSAKNGETLEDLKPLLPYIDYLLPNESEAELLTGVKDPEENARRFTEAGAGCVVIKCGRKGCLIRKGDQTIRIPSYHIEYPVDSTGAGDGLVAGFIWGLCHGLSLEDCGRFACAAASCIVEQVGANAGIASAKEPLRRFEVLSKMQESGGNR